jgi:hypothetical protein
MPRQPSREKTARHRLRQAGDLPQLPTHPHVSHDIPTPHATELRQLPLQQAMPWPRAPLPLPRPTDRPTWLRVAQRHP